MSPIGRRHGADGARLAGIVVAVKEGRVIFQRILTYTLNSITKKIVQVLFLAAGLILTGHAILTPLLMVLIMITGDFLGMSLTTDNVRPSPTPNAWRIGNLTIAGIATGIGELIFCTAILCFGIYRMGFDVRHSRPSPLSSSCSAIRRRPIPIEDARACGPRVPVFGSLVIPGRHSDRLGAGDRRHFDGAFAGRHRSGHDRGRRRLLYRPGFRDRPRFFAVFGSLRTHHPLSLDDHLERVRIGGVREGFVGVEDAVEHPLPGLAVDAVDDRRGAEALRHLEATIIAIDHDDLGRRIELGGEKGREPDRSRSDNSHGVARLNLAVEHAALEAGWQDVAQHHQRLLEHRDARPDLVDDPDPLVAENAMTFQYGDGGCRQNKRPASLPAVFSCQELALPDADADARHADGDAGTINHGRPVAIFIRAA